MTERHDAGRAFRRKVWFVLGTGMITAGTVLAFLDSGWIKVALLILGGITLSNWPVARSIIQLVVPSLPGTRARRISPRREDREELP